jgi:hypothetical protein
MSNWFWGPNPNETDYFGRANTNGTNGTNTEQQQLAFRQYEEYIERQKETRLEDIETNETMLRALPKHCPGKSLDGTLDIDAQGNVVVVPLTELAQKARALFHAYENNYRKFLNTPKFWNELVRFRHISGTSYDALFLERIVFGAAPVQSERKLREYGDVIEIAYSLAVKYRLCGCSSMRKKNKSKSGDIDKCGEPTCVIGSGTEIEAPSGFFGSFFKTKP